MRTYGYVQYEADLRVASSASLARVRQKDEELPFVIGKDIAIEH